MCGICGLAFADPERPSDGKILAEMAGALRHRGPDSDGLHAGPGAGLAVQRLGIIDVEGGDQPLYSEDGRVVLVCNGEIYNYVELREELEGRGHRFSTASDSEVVLHLYEELGPDCVRRLRGMFAIAPWDGARRRLFLARDRLGIKPLVYHERRGTLVFASEAKALLHSGELSARLEPAVLKDLLTFGYVLSPRTWFAGVRRLPPDHRLIYAGGRSTVEPYWGISFPAAAERSSRSADEWAEGLREKMEETVRIHLRSDVPVGVWLSPGIDSSAVAGLMAPMTNGRVQAFSIGFEDRECDELEGRRTLADFPEYGLEGRTVRLGPGDFDDLPEIVRYGESMSALGLKVPRWVLSRVTAGQVKTVLTGEGSDEILCGYGWYRAERLFGPSHRLPALLRRVLSAAMRQHPRWKPNTARQFLSSPPADLARYQGIVGVPWNADSAVLLSVERRREAADSGEDSRVSPSDPPGFQGWPPFAQIQYRDLTVRMPDYIVHHLDHMSMAHSLEARVPFLDHELVEYCASIPPDLKMKGLREKDVLRRAMEGVLPGEILARQKRGMTSPLESWMRGSSPILRRRCFPPKACGGRAISARRR